MKNKKLVMFDFDGVLIDTLILSYEISLEVNEGVNLSEYKDRFHGNIIESLKEHDGTFNSHPEFFKKYTAGARELKIPTGLLKVLEDLKNKDDVFLAIVSSTPSQYIKDILEREKASNYFRDIFGSDVNKSKVIKINSLLEKYDIKPDDAVFITDTVGDIKEARECNVKSIAVAWGFHERERLESVNPLKIVDNPTELMDVIVDVIK